ncbi:hypothetical protein HanIR_Chr11g0546591 [Helianthus annuus]|nr:hypothetical protein HanIR_Chr11g0546591 [Helianthus annuus]
MSTCYFAKYMLVEYISSLFQTTNLISILLRESKLQTTTMTFLTRKMRMTLSIKYYRLVFGCYFKTLSHRYVLCDFSMLSVMFI